MDEAARAGFDKERGRRHGTCLAGVDHPAKPARRWCLPRLLWPVAQDDDVTAVKTFTDDLVREAITRLDISGNPQPSGRRPIADSSGSLGEGRRERLDP